MEWPKLGILNLFKPFSVQKDWKKFRMAKIRHSEFIQTFLVQKEWKKFRTAKIGTKAMGIANRYNGS